MGTTDGDGKVRRGVVAAVAAVAFCATGLAQGWLQREVLSGDRDLTQPGMAYDEARGRMVSFAGGETWELEGSHWTRRYPAHAPAPDLVGAIAFDAARGRTLLFACSFSIGQTWEWDGVDWRMLVPSQSPPPTTRYAMAYDRTRQRVVMFGGSTYPFSADTWEWDGSTWSRVTPVLSPLARVRHAMAYDAARGRIVMFGGENFFTSARLDDTWEWDGVAWTQATPAAHPDRRIEHALAYDAVRQVVVLFSGMGYDGRYRTDTWEWDGSAWTQRSPQTVPPPRSGHALAFDVARGVVVLFGGANVNAGGSYLASTFEWNGVDWAPRGQPQEPPFGDRHAAAYDKARGQLIVFGADPEGFARMHAFDGQRWSRLTPTPMPSSNLRGHAMAYDAARARIVLFGGKDYSSTRSDTWEWDGSTWRLQQPALRPSARMNHSMVYDAARRCVVMHGGDDGTTQENGFGDTWTWDGASWTLLHQLPVNDRYTESALAYDELRQRVVLFGGRIILWFLGQPLVSYGDVTREWDGSSWTTSSPTLRPTTRAGHAMAYDELRRRVVCFGGRGGLNGWYWNDTWEWDGTAWSQINAAGPSARIDHVMAWDSTWQRIVLAAGTGVVQLRFHDTWIYGNVVPPLAEPFGTACAGSSGLPIALGRGVPWIGQAGFGIEASRLLPQTPTFAFLALGGASLSLGNGCMLHVDPASVFAILGTASNAAGFASVPLPVPDLPALRGVSLWSQAAAADPGGAVAGWSLSQGLRLVIGG